MSVDALIVFVKFLLQGIACVDKLPVLEEIALYLWLLEGGATNEPSLQLKIVSSILNWSEFPSVGRVAAIRTPVTTLEFAIWIRPPGKSYASLRPVSGYQTPLCKISTA